MSEWHVSQNGKQGPTMQEAELQAAIQAGQVGPDDQVWNTTMTNWQRVAEVPALAGSLPAAPVAALGTMSYQMPHSGPLMFTETAMQSLKGTKPWARFMAVICFIFAGFTLLGAAAMMIAIGMSPARVSSPPALVGVAYLVIAAIYVLFGVLLNSYATRIGKVLRYRTEDTLEAAIEAQRKFWRLSGITVIVCIVLYFLTVAIVVAYGAMR